MSLSKNQSYGIGKPDNSTVKSYGRIERADKFGTDLAMRSKATPPVSAYDEYVRVSQHRCSVYHHHRDRFQGCFLRRAVIMRRNGSTWKECGQAIGVSASAINGWVQFLPLELQP